MTVSRTFLAVSSCALVSLFAAQASAAGLDLARMEKAPNMDGIPGEWPGSSVSLSSSVKGKTGGADLAATTMVAFDDKNLYVAVEVKDDVFKGGEGGDRVDVVLSLGGSAQTVTLVPGLPGKSAGKATLGGKAISGAKVVEAPDKTGWSLEASFPWSALDGASTTRVGMKAGIFVFDVDGDGSVEGVVGTVSSTDKLAPLRSLAEQSLEAGLIKEKKLGTPSSDLLANVFGDSMKERVLVNDKFLVVLGPNFRSGKEYYWNDMATAGFTLSVKSLTLRDVDGDGRDDLVFTKRFTKSKTTREVMHILSFGTSEVPTTLFIHETSVETEKGTVTNEITFGSDGGKPTITVKPGSAKGLDAKSYAEPTEAAFDSIVLPWGNVESQTYKLKGSTFDKSEKTKPQAAVETKPEPKTTATTNNTTTAPKVDAGKLYEAYKKDRSIKGSPAFDVNADVAEDGTSERVVVHGTELAVLGTGYKGGTSYSYVSLPFASAGDVKTVTTKDVSGDGKQDILVRGILKAKGPNKEDVERTVELVYRVTKDGVRRVFAAELSRAIGSNKVTGNVSYDGKGNITLTPGKASGFTKESYPFAEDTSAVGGVEPLLLPWGSQKSLKYKWGGSSFDKQ
ncbi:MAG: hypothetical protein U0271_11010 [Polyangiaceae bacterium]